MTKTRTSWLLAAVGAGALYAGALVLAGITPGHRAVESKARERTQPHESPPKPALPASVALTSPERAAFETLDPGGKEAVATFLTNTPGPLDNYLLNLEDMVDVANARYGTPDKERWRHALPVARVLEEGMCDCAQRNWLNQFIALGEAGLSEDLAAYHQQGETMASIGRRNDDPVVSR